MSMCGICGLVFRDPRSHVQAEKLQRMANTIRHRGPDDEGILAVDNIGLAHRRLAILDLSAAGHQPMSNEDGSVWIVFNGEIYNFAELRHELEQRHQFRSRTDTEVLIHLYEERGPAMLDRLDGMFALAIWDRPKHRLFMARDPFGIKPLYVALNEERMVFGSELKPLLASGHVSRDIDQGALNDFFDFYWIPAPRSIYREVRKLRPGEFWELDLQSWHCRVERYWQPAYRPRTGLGLEEWTDAVDEALSRSVKSQLVSDVPLGAFLSGGIDSTLVSTAAANALKPSPLRTFTIDFADKKFSERSYAQQVAQHLNADAKYDTASPATLDQLPRLSEFYDEPFADSSLLPTDAVSRITRERVTVALSGDGGDELFSGYHHHKLARQVSRFDVLPRWLTGGIFGALARVTPSGTRVQDWSARFANDPDNRRFSTIRLPARSSRLALIAPQLRQAKEDRYWFTAGLGTRLQGLPPATQIQLFDLEFYLPSDMLVKVDRASMAHSLEVRVPFLSRSIAELAFSIPDEIRYDTQQEKRVLRNLVQRTYGAEFAQRTKMGFGIPLRNWVREAATPERLEDLLRSTAVTNGTLDAAGIRHLFQAIWRGGGHWFAERSDELFALFVFDAWWNRYQV
jgi:asparagine synthase (glutamine-hydrolysing)